MSLRATFLLLILANLAFLGWTALIDVPPEQPPSDSISNLPQLKLLSEEHGAASSHDPAAGSAASTSVAGVPTAAQGNAPAANSSASGESQSAAASVGSTSAGPTSAASVSAGAASAGSAPAARASPAVASNALAGSDAANAGRRCITIGPFGDPERAREAAEVLRERGFSPRGRTAAGGPQGYWVFIGGLKSPADETNVLHRLERNGISDAKAMPASQTGRRISVGLFNALDGAERRARAVRRLGLEAQVEPRQTEEAHWVDVNLDSSGQSLPAEGLLSLEEPGSRMEIKECPGSVKPPASIPSFAPQIPKPLTAAGRPRPG